MRAPPSTECRERRPLSMQPHHRHRHMQPHVLCSPSSYSISRLSFHSSPASPSPLPILFFFLLLLFFSSSLSFFYLLIFIFLLFASPSFSFFFFSFLPVPLSLPPHFILLFIFYLPLPPQKHPPSLRTLIAETKRFHKTTKEAKDKKNN